MDQERARGIILSAIASPDFAFKFENLDEYWATLSTSTRKVIRDGLEHVGDRRIAPCVLSLLAHRWRGRPVKLLKTVCGVLVSNLVFSAILMSVGACLGPIETSENVKTVADNFEAYVAAYARQFGPRRLKLWVHRAFAPLVDAISPAFTGVTEVVPEVTISVPVTKRKGRVDSQEPAQKKSRIQPETAPIAPLGDRTNGQTRRARRRAAATRAKQSNIYIEPLNSFQRMSDPPAFAVKQPLSRPTLLESHSAEPPSLAQRMSDPPEFKTKHPLARLPSLQTFEPLSLFQRMKDPPAFAMKQLPSNDIPQSRSTWDGFTASVPPSSAHMHPRLASPAMLPQSQPAAHDFTMSDEPHTANPFPPHPSPGPFMSLQDPPARFEWSGPRFFPAVSPSRMPWWSVSGVFASAMEDIGMPMQF